jgi:hypothetical protein
MPEPSITERVTTLEQKVEALASLPARVTALEVQIVQLRDEMRVEFSAVRQEMAVLREDLRGELRAELHKTTDMLRTEIRAGDEETRRYMRVLHEEVLARIAALSESRRPRRRS